MIGSNLQKHSFMRNVLFGVGGMNLAVSPEQLGLSHHIQRSTLEYIPIQNPIMHDIYTHLDHIIAVKMKQSNTNSRNPWQSTNTLRLATATAEAFRAIPRRTEESPSQDGMEQ